MPHGRHLLQHTPETLLGSWLLAVGYWLFFMVGLLAAMYGGNIQSRLLSPNPNINFGSVFENFVAQELYAHGFSEAQQHSLYYFNECLLYYPIYMITFFEQTQAEERVYKFDLTGL